MYVGVSVEANTGAAEGSELGVAVGISVLGTSVGSCEGPEGLTVGSADGAGVLGAELGVLDGLADGDSVSAYTGAAEGLSVGAT